MNRSGYGDTIFNAGLHLSVCGWLIAAVALAAPSPLLTSIAFAEMAFGNAAILLGFAVYWGEAEIAHARWVRYQAGIA